MKNAEPEDLYVGYLAPTAPVARRLRRIAIAFAAAALAIGAAVSASHSALPASAFEFGTVRSFEGVVRESPVPMLLVARPDASGARTPSAWLLVGPGKHGAGGIVHGLDGATVRLSGTLVYRDGQTMVEVVPDSVERSAGAAAVQAPAAIDLGTVTLSGEIVDSKCYLGVMNPGQAKTHRDCAVRCISGGAPPLFVARDAQGRTIQALLVGEDGRALGRDLLPFVAEPVEITGRLASMGDLFVLHTATPSIRRLN